MSISQRLMGEVGAIFALMAMATTAFGGSYFEKDGAALRGYDPVAYFTENKPVKGSPAYQVAHKGSTFHFASQANRDLFKADPRGMHRNTMGSAPTARRPATRPRSTPPRTRSSMASCTSTTTPTFRRSGSLIFRDTSRRPTRIGRPSSHRRRSTTNAAS